MGEPCRNQGAALAEKPCGYCHEGPCDPSSFVVLRRFDVEALLEEWGDLDEDPFWKPLGDSVRIVAAGWSEGDALSRLASVTRERDALREAAGEAVRLLDHSGLRSLGAVEMAVQALRAALAPTPSTDDQKGAGDGAGG